MCVESAAAGGSGLLPTAAARGCGRSIIPYFASNSRLKVVDALPLYKIREARVVLYVLSLQSEDRKALNV